MTTIRIGFVLLFLTLLTGCFGEDAPTIDEVENYVKVRSRLARDNDFNGDHYAIRNISIVASEHTGSEISPKMTLKARAEIHLLEDLYREGIGFNGVRILRLVTSADDGIILKFYFLLDAEKRGENWVIIKDYDHNQEGPSISGNPLSNYRKGIYVIEGTAAADELRARHDAFNEAERAAAKERNQEKL